MKVGLGDNDQLVKDSFTYGGLAGGVKRDLLRMEIEQIERLAEEAWKPHSLDPQGDAPPREGYKIMNILMLQAVIEVKIPVFLMDRYYIYLNPLSIGCFPTNPSLDHEKGSWWVKRDVLDFYAIAGPKFGLSVTGFLESLTHMQAYHGPSTQLKASKFEEYFCVYLDSIKAGTTMDAMGLIPTCGGPFKHCPVCGGHSDDEFKLTMISDACKKGETDLTLCF